MQNSQALEKMKGYLTGKRRIAGPPHDCYICGTKCTTRAEIDVHRYDNHPELRDFNNVKTDVARLGNYTKGPNDSRKD